MLQKEGLEQLVEALGTSPLREAFEQAVARILALEGRVIVTGIGKSGHIGRKIQATLASTGTASFFLHPAEAAHGDLGIISKDDLLLVLSNSGETDELGPVLAYAARYGIEKIAITGNASSTLARSAQICLVLPKVREACPIGLAPTTSTLLQLATGDALAVALLESRGFSRDDFGRLHPAGALGNCLRPLSTLMHTGSALPLGKMDMPFHAVILEMTQKAFGCMGVVDDAGRLCGLVSDGDLRQALGRSRLERDMHIRTARDIMNPAPVTASPDLLVQEALHLMNDRSAPISSLFIVNDAAYPLGIVHLHDLLRSGAA